jgi:hypothetical protein
LLYCLNSGDETDSFVLFNFFSSSVAEYPFATLTSLGSTISPPVSTARETSLSYPIVVAVKVLTTVFFSACLIVAAFYLSHLLRKWKLKRDHHYHGHHVFFGGGPGSGGGSGSSPMFDSLSLAEAGPGHGLRHALRFNRRRRRRTPQSPILPPFKSSDTLCTASGPASNSASFGPQDTWNKDICPYATFQLPRDQQPSQQQQQQQQLQQASQQNRKQSEPEVATGQEGQQVTITLQHHGQLEENFAQATDTYHHHHQANVFLDPLFGATTETFKIKPSAVCVVVFLPNLGGYDQFHLD